MFFRTKDERALLHEKCTLTNINVMSARPATQLSVRDWVRRYAKRRMSRLCSWREVLRRWFNEVQRRTSGELSHSRNGIGKVAYATMTALGSSERLTRAPSPREGY